MDALVERNARSYPVLRPASSLGDDLRVGPVQRQQFADPGVNQDRLEPAVASAKREANASPSPSPSNKTVPAKLRDSIAARGWSRATS